MIKKNENHDILHGPTELVNQGHAVVDRIVHDSKRGNKVKKV
jgi:hypothetical protein